MCPCRRASASRPRKRRDANVGWPRLVSPVAEGDEVAADAKEAEPVAEGSRALELHMHQVIEQHEPALSPGQGGGEAWDKIGQHKLVCRYRV